jgi:hypothetical protein
MMAKRQVRIAEDGLSMTSVSSSPNPLDPATHHSAVYDIVFDQGTAAEVNCLIRPSEVDRRADWHCHRTGFHAILPT